MQTCAAVHLTDADGGDDRRSDDGEGDAPGDGQVPPVPGRLLPLIMGVNLRRIQRLSSAQACIRPLRHLIHYGHPRVQYS